MSLVQAREIFKRDFADRIQRGRSIKIAGDVRPSTVGDLFEAYTRSLKEAGKPSWKETEKGLNKIANTLGRNRLAREIESDDVVEVIRPIYKRGKRFMADHVRCHVHAAFSWGLKSEHFSTPLLAAMLLSGASALLFQRTAPLGSVLLASPMIIIFFFHIFLTGMVLRGATWAGILAALARGHRDAFKALVMFREPARF